MRNHYRSGTDAQIFADGLEKAIEKVEDAAGEACDSIEYLEGEVEEKEEDIEDLQKELEELHAKLNDSDAEDFLRVLRNIRIYIDDNIKRVEAKNDGDNTEGSETPEKHIGEQPAKG